MLHFSPTEEQEEVRRLAQSLAVEQLRVQARSAEKIGDISPALMETLTQTGLTTPFPEEYGGSGKIEAITYALIAEELGFGDGGQAMNIIGSMMGPLTVALAGHQDQQEQFIPPFCNASSTRGSLAYAERTGGYSVADISATARRDGDNYIINGTKRDIFHGGKSNPQAVLVRLEDSGALGAFVLPAHVEGLQVTHDTQK